MADGLLGGFGDFLTGQGVYADPQAINKTYGVPEGDVRQAAINQLAQLSAIALAAGQPMEGRERAQILGQLGQVGSNFNTNLYNAAQRRLMTTQMMEKQDEADRIRAMAQKVKDDPEGLAKSLSAGGAPLSVDLVKTLPTKSLVELASQIAVKKATQSPLEQMTQQRVAQLLTGGGAAPVGGVSAPAAANAPPVEGTTATPIGPVDTSVASIRKIATDPFLSVLNPKLAKEYADLAAAAEPAGVREAQILKAKTEEAKAEALPKLELSVANRSLQTKSLLDAIEKAKSQTGVFSAGFGANLAGTKGTEASDLANTLKYIQANIGFDQLKQMKDESATGASGLGQLAVAEMAALQSVLGSIDQGQTPKQLKENLDKLATTLRNFEKVRMNAFEKEYKRKPDIAGLTAGTEQGGIGGTTSGGLTWSIK